MVIDSVSFLIGGLSMLVILMLIGWLFGEPPEPTTTYINKTIGA
jgi:hypothetical protein